VSFEQYSSWNVGDKSSSDALPRRTFREWAFVSTEAQRGSGKKKSAPNVLSTEEGRERGGERKGREEVLQKILGKNRAVVIEKKTRKRDIR